MLEVKGLTYRYPDTSQPALRGISFTLEAGHVLLVAGRTGSGKSTLCYALSGFVPHFYRGEIEGDVLLAGRSMRQTELGEWVTRVGLVLQNPFNQISGARATVFEEVAFGLENLGVPRGEMGERVCDVLARLEIESLADRSPYALSGGQQQRVAIASVLAMRPDLLVLDEPTAQLDPDGTAEVLHVVRGLADEGTTVVIATHQLAEVSPFLTHALLLHEGKMVRYEAASSLVRDPTLAEYGVEPPLYVSAGAALGQNPPPLTAEALLATETSVAPLDISYYPFSLTSVEVDPVAQMPVTVESVSFSYPGGVQALKQVSVHFEPGEITAIIGANGAGKSTLARTLNGLLQPHEGRIRVGDWDVSEHKTHEVAKRVGYLFQNPDDQLFKSTVWDEVAFAPTNFVRMEGTASPDPRPAIEHAVERALALTGLTSLPDSHPYDLHAVQRRWVALASVLAGGAPVLVLDEPTSGFDLTDKTQLAAVALGLRNAGYTLLIVSHDLQLVAELADRIVVMDDGRIAGQGSAAEIFGDEALWSRLDGILPPVARLGAMLGRPSLVQASKLVTALRERRKT